MNKDVRAEIKRVEKLFDENKKGRVYIKNAPRRMAREIVKGHRARKAEIRKAERRIDEIQNDVFSPKIDGMPKTNRPYTDYVGERVAKIEQLRKYVDRGKEWVEAVDKAYDAVGRDRRITRDLLFEWGGKPEIYRWARTCVQIVMEHPDTPFGSLRYPWGYRSFRKDTRIFLDTIARELDLGDAPQ